ncbi:MAG: TrmH family RNA methyltransferase [Patescibacteria group bacterium]|nr:TrmH family RNA methyltransferase [Patescibacteria group bacterium]
MIIIAHNIRSMYNVGSIFRNAAAFNIEKLYLTGISAIPPRKEIAKVALGAVDLVNWEAGEIEEVITRLKTEGYHVYGLEQGKGSISLDVVVGGLQNKKIALVLGNEVEGIDKETIKLLDGLIEIPMGKKRSLNVSVASGIAMFVLGSK